MWWVEEAEKDLERERQKKVREKRGRQTVDRKLTDYCTALISDSIPGAETLLDRAVRVHDLQVAAKEILTSVK
jgi:hypothetical protein